MAKKKKKPTPPPPPVRSKPPRAATAPVGPTRREQQRKVQQSAERRDGLRRKAVSAGLVLGLLALVGAYVVYDRRGDAQLRDALTAGSCTVDDETDPTAPQGQNHVPNPSYRVNPPSGGDHLAGPARGGVYTGTRVPAEGALVHSLEHGYIVAWHSPELPPEQITLLQEFEAEHEGDVIVAERTGMQVPVAATAWGQRLLCQEVEPAVIERFFDEYVGKGPEDVDRG